MDNLPGTSTTALTLILEQDDAQATSTRDNLPELTDGASTSSYTGSQGNCCQSNFNNNLLDEDSNNAEAGSLGHSVFDADEDDVPDEVPVMGLSTIEYLRALSPSLLPANEPFVS